MNGNHEKTNWRITNYKWAEKRDPQRATSQHNTTGNSNILTLTHNLVLNCYARYCNARLSGSASTIMVL